MAFIRLQYFVIKDTFFTLRQEREVVEALGGLCCLSALRPFGQSDEPAGPVWSRIEIQGRVISRIVMFVYRGKVCISENG